ncbi:unnamed protein product [Soboliphyme baturini]|uniref:Uncharacterized protein n=1 Tax=Soboliphyme baturini TaxID=241478 RepID=A0A183IQ55_9BILA|nr:unnamed protein product [Soboliphyme baturini]
MHGDVVPSVTAEQLLARESYFDVAWTGEKQTGCTSRSVSYSTGAGDGRERFVASSSPAGVLVWCSRRTRWQTMWWSGSTFFTLKSLTEFLHGSFTGKDFNISRMAVAVAFAVKNRRNKIVAAIRSDFRICYTSMTMSMTSPACHAFCHGARSLSFGVDLLDEAIDSERFVREGNI